MCRGTSGFTLVEILVVIVIIGVLAVGAVLAVSAAGGDRELEREGDRLLALVTYAREHAELQTREYGLRVDPDGYGFVGFDPRHQRWVAVENDEVLRERRLPEGLRARLWIEGREVVLRRAPARERDDGEPDAAEPMPQIMLFSNGDLTPFELRLERVGASAHVAIASDERARIVASGLAGSEAT